MFATGNEEGCPIMLFKQYLEKRPSEIKESGPFYLTVIDKPVSSIWYKEKPNGKEDHKHDHEKHDKELTAEGSVSREESDQPQCTKNRGKEAEQFLYPKV